jgi:hypothetical protein
MLVPVINRRAWRGTTENEAMPRKSKPLLGEPLVVSPAEAQRLLDVGPAHFYDTVLPELESYKDGKARRITLRSIKARIERKLAEAGAK